MRYSAATEVRHPAAVEATTAKMGTAAASMATATTASRRNGGCRHAKR